VERYSEALERYKAVGGYDYEREIDRVARGIGIFQLLGSKLKEVSGGQRTKIALAKILLLKPDFLLLDEPTNFIDLKSAEWLEKYLQESWKGGYLIISHDREFLDATCTKVYDVVKGCPIVEYVGNYSDYVYEKRKKEERLTEEYERHLELVKTEKSLINRFRAGSRAGFAKSREKMLERLEEPEKPSIPPRPKFRFEFSERPGEKILEFKEAFIGRKEPLFFISEVVMREKNRIGVVGENGAGKSTLIKTILGRIPLLDGYFSKHKALDIAYYSQMHEELDMDATVLANFERVGFAFTRERLASILGNYGFEYADVDRRVRDFSGGQVSKILFSMIGLRPSNILILDEPTNHLDYDSREALEKTLKEYPGTILFISHDRYFVNKVASHLWIVEDGELTVSYGNYADYRLKKDRGISYDVSLWNDAGELDMVLEEKLGKAEAKRIKEKFGRNNRK
jgi:ATP-binding cassette subfamily F protein 3